MSKSTKSLNKSKPDRAAILTRIDHLIKIGRKEITTKKELEKFSIGSVVSYMNTRNDFKVGGFIMKFCDEYFIYIMPDFITKIRVRYVNILKMWVGNVYEVKNDIVSIVTTPQEKTNFYVKVNDIFIYYGKRQYDIDRFKNSRKYQNIDNWIKYFES